MKHILTTPELRILTVDFLADKDSGFPTKEVNGKQVPYGFTGKQQAELTLKLLLEAVFTDAAPDQISAAYLIINAMSNGSAARQAMESAGLLAKSEGGKAQADANALADKYAAKYASK